MKIIRDICPKLKESVEIDMGQCTNKNFIIKISTNVDEEIGAIIIIAQLFEHRQVCIDDDKGYDVYLFGSSYTIPFCGHNVYNEEKGTYVMVPLILYRHVHNPYKINKPYDIAVWLKYEAEFNIEIPLCNDKDFKMFKDIHTKAGMSGKIVIATGRDAKLEMGVVTELCNTIDDNY